MPSQRANFFSGLSALHIATLFTLAVAHPLYDLLIKGDHATIFVAHQSQPIDIWLLVLSLSFLLPLVLFAALWILNCLSPHLASALYAVLLALLAATLFLLVSATLLPVLGNANALVALIAALGLTVLYHRASLTRAFLTFMSPVILLSPLLFITDPAIRSLIREPEGGSRESRATTRKLPNIVIVVFDELPLASLLDADRSIDEGRYPNFARLAATSTWYRNTTTVHYSTRYSIPSILTGIDHWSYMRRHNIDGVRNPGVMLDQMDFPNNVFTLFEATHSIYASLSTMHVSRQSETEEAYIPPLSERFRSLSADLSILYAHQITPMAVRDRLPSIQGQWQDFLGSRAPVSPSGSWPYKGGKADRIRQLVNFMHTGNRPSLYVVHIVFPHRPFKHNERGQIHENKTPIGDDRVKIPQGRNIWPDELSANAAYQAHLLQLGFTDLLLGHVLDRLEALDLFRDSLLVVTADHGISFYWDDEGMPYTKLYGVQASEILYVPLLIKAPRQTRPGVSDKMVQTIDILPTIADMLNVPIPWEVEGVSASSEQPSTAKRFAWLMATKKEFESLIDPEYLALKRKIALFGSDRIDLLYNSGPHKEIVNSSVTEWPAIDAGALVRLSGDDKYRDIDPAGASVPAYVGGEITNASALDRPCDLTIAVAVNGTIRGTTKARQEAGTLLFLIRIPVESFVKGRNAVTVHGVVEDERGRPSALMHFAPN